MTNLFPATFLFQAFDPSRFNDFLLLAYGAMWLIVIVYVANLANKQRNLHQEIKLMRRLLEEDEGENQR